MDPPSAPPPAPRSSEHAHASGADAEKRQRRPRSARGNENRATTDGGDAPSTENGHDVPVRPMKTQRPPRDSQREKTANTGESNEEVTNEAARPKRQPRERRPKPKRDGKSNVAQHGKLDASGAEETSSAAGDRSNLLEGREDSKHDKKKHEDRPAKQRRDRQRKANADGEPHVTQEQNVDVHRTEEATLASDGRINKREARKGKKNRRQENQADGGDATQDEEDEPAVVDWSTAAWFMGCDADLGTAYWLLARAHACDDVAVLESETLVRRAIALQKLHTQLKTELLPHDEHEDGDESVPTQKEWSTVGILNATITALKTDATKDEEHHSQVVSMLEGELIDVTTELLMNRLGREELDLLLQWDSFLASLLRIAEVSKPENTGKGNDDAEAENSVEEKNAAGEDGEDVIDGIDDDEIAPAPLGDESTPEINAGVAGLLPPRKRTRRGTNNSIAQAKALVTATIEFHREYEYHVVAAAYDEKLTSLQVSEALWSKEITSIFEGTLVTPDDESKRKGVAAQIEHAFRRSSQWRECEILLFGSSLSKFGSKTSDLDLCLRLKRADPEEANVKMSVRELKLRMRRLQQLQNGDVPSSESRNDDAPFLKELRDKSHKALEVVVNRLKKQRNKTTHKRNSKIHQLAQLLAHWKAIVVALQFFYDKLADGATRTKKHREAAADAAAAYHTAVHKQQKQRQKDIYAAAALLGRNGCEVDLVVAHARVPVIGFTHKASGFECDLCFDNYHACINTLLLRTYAEVDDRARTLGVAIKHWAKRRGINDASTGFLSSYSFILLVIYFLQHKVCLLPNLQHPELLRSVNVEPMMMNGVDVSFCGNVVKARAFHTTQLEEKALSPPSDSLSVGSLLLSFFHFYAEEFDFSQHVVSIRHPEQPIHKRDRWEGNKLKAWRISIEDPLEYDRDLGSVLQYRGQQQILEETKRALKLLNEGESFETVVCEDTGTKNASTKKNTRKKPNESKQPKKVGGRETKKDARRDRAHREAHTKKPHTKHEDDAKDDTEDSKPASNPGRRMDKRHTPALEVPADDKPRSNRGRKPDRCSKADESTPLDGKKHPRSNHGRHSDRQRAPDHSAPPDTA